VRVTIDEPAERSPIRQLLVTVPPEQKPAALVRVLAAHPHESALVFCNFKASVADVTRALADAGIDARTLHGDLEQYDRDQVLARFRNGSTRVLVATDVAGRGLDVEDLELVVNYDVPQQPEVYVHRIGRTGRAGKGGLAISIAGPREGKKLDAIQAATGVPLAPLALEGGATAPPPKEARMDTIQISGGRKDKVRPGDIQGALTGDAGGLAAADIGKIEIHDHFSYVAVARHVSAAAVRSLCDGRIKGRRFRARLVT
jgi:ATP-independent RNA helicase DbpA